MAVNCAMSPMLVGMLPVSAWFSIKLQVAKRAHVMMGKEMGGVQPQKEGIKQHAFRRCEGKWVE